MVFDNLNIKIKDVLVLVFFVATSVLGYSSINNKQELILLKFSTFEEHTKERVSDDKDKSNESNIWRRSIETRLNSIDLQNRLVEQRLLILESK